MLKEKLASVISDPRDRKNNDTVLKDDDITFMIKKPGEMPINSQKSDLPKIGPKAEKRTLLKNYYAKRRPKIPSEMITNDIIGRHERDSKRKVEGRKRIP